MDLFDSAVYMEKIAGNLRECAIEHTRLATRARTPKAAIRHLARADYLEKIGDIRQADAELLLDVAAS